MKVEATFSSHIADEVSAVCTVIMCAVCEVGLCSCIRLKSLQMS